MCEPSTKTTHTTQQIHQNTVRTFFYVVVLNTWTRVLSTRGSSISLKTNAIFSVSAAALAILNFFELLIVFFGDLKPDAMRLTR